MATSSLLAYNGARKVDLDTLKKVPCPDPTDTYFPVPHHQVLKETVSLLEAADFKVASMELALSRHDERFFGTLDLSAPVATGVNLCVGIWSSTDRSLPLGLVGGNRVFVCSNLAFRADLINVRRKHTKRGLCRFQEAIARAVGQLELFRQAERARIQRFQITDVTDTQAESLMLKAYERDIVSHRLLPRVIQEWRNPSFKEFEERNLWSLWNAFTTVLGDRQRTNPQLFASLTIQLSDLLSEIAGVRPDEQLLQTPA